MIAVHDVSVDHRFAANLEGVGFGTLAQSHGLHIDRESAVGNGGGIVAISGRYGPVDRDIDDGFAIGGISEDETARAAAVVVSVAAGDRPLALERTEVADRSCLAGESEKLLDLTRGGHDSGTAML